MSIILCTKNYNYNFSAKYGRKTSTCPITSACPITKPQVYFHEFNSIFKFTQSFDDMKIFYTKASFCSRKIFY